MTTDARQYDAMVKQQVEANMIVDAEVIPVEAMVIVDALAPARTDLAPVNEQVQELLMLLAVQRTT